MTNVSISTTWGQRYENVAEFIHDAREFGFTHMELNSSLDHERLKELLASEGLLISSIHAPCPNTFTRKGIKASSLSLAALNEDERREAINFTRSTIELAGEVGAKAVVVHAGWAHMKTEMERDLRRLYEQGLADTSEFDEFRHRLIQTRESVAFPHVEAAKKSLSELVSHARASGIRLGLENRVDYHEIPNLGEMRDILAELDSEVVGYWHDVGHAEIQSRIGFTPHGDWLTALRDRIIGVHLHDVRDLSDHHAPGIGDLDWDFIARNLPIDALRVCEIGEWNSWKDASQAVTFLRTKGIL